MFSICLCKLTAAGTRQADNIMGSYCRGSTGVQLRPYQKENEDTESGAPLQV